MPKLPDLGKRIGRRLIELGFSKAGRPDIAKFCADKGYRPQYVYAWLAGRTPSYENLVRLATDLGVSRSWLAVGDEAIMAVAAEGGRESLESRQPGRARAGREHRRPSDGTPVRSAQSMQAFDFTRLRDVTAKLVEVETQLAAIFEAFPDLYIWVDGAGAILDWKGGRSEVPDVLLEPCVGKLVDEVFPGDTGSRLRQALTTAMLTGTPGTLEHTAAVGGVERTFEARLVPFEASGGQALIVVRDVSDRRRAEQAIRDSEARYRALAEGSIEGICIVQDGLIRFANQALCDIFGYARPDALLGQPVLILNAPEESDRLTSYRLARLQGKPAPKRYEFKGIRADGRPLWFENVITVLPWDGRSAILATIQDVTDRKRAEEASAALADIGRELAGTLDLNEVVARTLKRQMNLLSVGRAGVYVVDPVTGHLRCLAAAGESRPEAAVGREMAPGQGLMWKAIALGRAVSSPDLLNEPEIEQPEWAIAMMRAHGLSAVMAAPLAIRGRTVGALMVGDVRGRHYSEHDHKLLAAVADHAAVAVDHAWRFRELEDRLDALQAAPQG